MPDQLHERYKSGDIQPPSARSTGVVFAAVALIVAVFWRENAPVLWTTLAVAVMLAALAWLKPAVLGPLNILWFRFGLLLHRVVNPVVMFAIFVLVFVPVGLLMRIWHDPLRRTRNRESNSYWIEREPEKPGAGSMKNQF